MIDAFVSAYCHVVLQSLQIFRENVYKIRRKYISKGKWSKLDQEFFFFFDLSHTLEARDCLPARIRINEYLLSAMLTGNKTSE